MSASGPSGPLVLFENRKRKSVQNFGTFTILKHTMVHYQHILSNTLALWYNFKIVYTNIPSCRQEESKMSFSLKEGICVYIHEYLYK